MFESVVTVGDKLHVITRRLFEGDLRRHFMGTVVGNTGEICELEGHVVLFHAARNEWVRRPDTRRRILSLSDGGHVVNRIPRSVEIGDLEYRMVEGELVVTDGDTFELNIDEFGPES